MAVYFLANPETHAIKIGHATDPRERLHRLQVGCPSTLQLLGVIPGGRTRERALHRAWRHFRLRGEWFRAEPRLLAEIRRLVADATTPAGGATRQQESEVSERVSERRKKMPRVTVENDAQVPVGAWPARLIDVKEMEPTEAHPDWGASYVWEFEVQSGPHRGKRCSCWTKQNATPLNNLGRLLVDLLGRPLREGDDFELRDFIGREYTIKVGPNKAGDKTRVNGVFPLQTPPAAAAPAPNGPVPTGPPPRKPKAAPAELRYWVAKSDSADAVLMGHRELQEWLAAEHKDPKEVEVALDGTAEYKSAADFGFTDEVPW